MEGMSLDGKKKTASGPMEDNVTLGAVKRNLKVLPGHDDHDLLPRSDSVHRSNSFAPSSQLVKASTLFQVRWSRTTSRIPFNFSCHLGRRYATFKLIYYDDTPHDYEPPLFAPADPEGAKFVFATHSASEAPEKISIGTLDTSHHAYAYSCMIVICLTVTYLQVFSVAITISSIASAIPTLEDNTAPYTGLGSGITNTRTNSLLSPKAALNRETEAQAEDAEKRNVLWDAEADIYLVPGSEDAEGEMDPDISMVLNSKVTRHRPIGIRGHDGQVNPYMSPLPSLSVVKSKRQDERTTNYNSQTSSKLVRRFVARCPLFPQILTARILRQSIHLRMVF
jgi:hypothetical protein